MDAQPDQPPRPDGAAAVDRESLDAERAALRVQAAAVAAQQAALAEEEERLNQRRAALDNQQRQLAEHLEDRRRRLRDAVEHLRKEKTAFQAEKADAERRRADAEAAVAQAQVAAEQERRQAAAERRRLGKVRRRLRQRWQEALRQREAELAQRAKELEGEKGRLGKEAEGLRKQRAVLHEAQLRFNGEAELGRRQLAEDRQELSLEQQRWEVCLHHEQQAQVRRLKALEDRADAVAAAEKELAQRQQQAEHVRDLLRREIDGLEARVRNTRQQLQEQEQALATARTAAAARPTLELPPPPPPLEPAADLAALPEALARTAEQLADQRARLLEQWQRLLAFHDAWQAERQEAVVGLEEAGRQLAERERELEGREQGLAARLAQLNQRQEGLSQMRCHLESWQGRLKVQTAEWESEKVRVAAEVEAAREAAETRQERLALLGRRGKRRWARELEGLRTARFRCDEARRQYLALLEECRQAADELEGGKRTLATEAVAVERLRQEVLGRAGLGGDKRLERLRREAEALVAAAEKRAESDRQALKAEQARLEERQHDLRKREETLLARHKKVLQTWTVGVAEGDAAAAEREELLAEVRRWQARHADDERRLAALREELERIAHILIDEGADAPAPQAA